MLSIITKGGLKRLRRLKVTVGCGSGDRAGLNQYRISREAVC